MIFLSIGQLIGQFSNQHPYLDPGSGSILIQLLLAGLLGAGILFRSVWRKIIPKKTKPKDSTTETESEDKSNNKGDGK
jgi:hypothetical protein